jgi:DNA-binding MarR family transcriptional regulator
VNRNPNHKPGANPDKVEGAAEGKDAKDAQDEKDAKDAKDLWLDPQTSAGYLVRDTHLAFAKALRTRLQQYDMTTGQYFFLRALWIEEGLSQRELSRRVGTTEPTTASAMRVLDKKGLVRRVRNAHDRRTVNIYPTDEGKRLQGALLAHARDINRAATGDISAGELDRAFEVLRTLKRNLDGGTG